MPEGWEAPPWGGSVLHTDRADSPPPKPQPLWVAGTGEVCFLFFPVSRPSKESSFQARGEWGEAETGWRKGEGRRVS